MKIINHKAMAALFAKAEELNQQSREGWKCIYFKIPRPKDRPYRALPHFNVDVVTHMLARMKGFVYLCDNGEIFILYRGRYNSLTTRLSIYLWSLYPEQPTTLPEHQIFSLFDLSGQWYAFYRFCEKRYMDVLARSETLAMFPYSETPIPAELLHNEHVAGYLK